MHRTCTLYRVVEPAQAEVKIRNDLTRKDKILKQLWLNAHEITHFKLHTMFFARSCHASPKGQLP